MPQLVTAYSEERALRLGFALLLTDRFTRQPHLLGRMNVSVAGRPAPFAKPLAGTFLFFKLPDGAYTVAVSSSPETPYYRPVNIPIIVPATGPLWPAYPDLALADQALPLDDPGQPPPYRDQRALAALLPSTQYPFPVGSTLVRGTVFAGTVPLAGAHVQQLGDALEYVSDANGQFVLFFDRMTGATKTITLRASHAAKPDMDVTVDLMRGMTVAKNIVMAP